MHSLSEAMGHKRGAIVMFFVAGAFVLGACSSSSPTAATTTGSSSAPPGSSGPGGGAAFQAYRDCLSQHGVTLPSRPPGQSGSDSSDSGGTDSAASGGRGGGGRGGFGAFSAPPGVDPSTFAAAQQACASVRPAGGGGRGGAGGPATAAYRSCMADHGVTIPAPSTDSTSSGPPPSIDRNDPAFQAANQVCRPLLPARGASGSSSSSSDSSSS